jgi:hypothetical protein
VGRDPPSTEASATPDAFDAEPVVVSPRTLAAAAAAMVDEEEEAQRAHVAAVAALQAAHRSPGYVPVASILRSVCVPARRDGIDSADAPLTLAQALSCPPKLLLDGQRSLLGVVVDAKLPSASSARDPVCRYSFFVRS